MQIEKPNKSFSRSVIVIFYGGLRLFSLYSGFFSSIRTHHPDCKIVLLTTKEFIIPARMSGCFDEIWQDDLRPWYDFSTNINMHKQFKTMNVYRVYDLEQSKRTEMYFRFSGRRKYKPQWVGAIDWCSHPVTNPEIMDLHILDRLEYIANVAGIKDVAFPDVSYLTADITRYDLPEAYGIISPGSSKEEEPTQWYEEGYAEVAKFLKNLNITPVFCGAEYDKALIDRIIALCPEAEAKNLAGKTNVMELADVGRGALVSIGTPNGGTYLAAIEGTPSVIMFAKTFIEPELAAPPSTELVILAENDLHKLEATEVNAAIISLLFEENEINELAQQVEENGITENQTPTEPAQEQSQTNL
jgi:ADP-heptose:LPS heptosyltransferase